MRKMFLSTACVLLLLIGLIGYSQYMRDPYAGMSIVPERSGIPLYPGLEKDPNHTIHYTVDHLLAHEVKAFYDERMPNLGWIKTGQQEQELWTMTEWQKHGVDGVLRIDAYQNTKDDETVVIFDLMHLPGQ